MARVVVVDVVAGEKLKNTAWFGMNQDPYVLVRSQPSGLETRTSSIWGGGVNPRWDRRKHNSLLALRVPEHDTALTFEIRNKNNVMADELIGTADLDIAVILPEAESSRMALPLRQGGLLHCSVYRKTSQYDRDIEEAIARSLDPSRQPHRAGSSQARGSGGRGGQVLGGTTLHRGESADEKRRAAAEAAEARAQNWRQGGAKDPAKAASLAERRRKDELIGKINAIYQVNSTETLAATTPTTSVSIRRRAGTR